LTYEYVEADHIVFEYKDYGDKFYVVLSGKASIMVPEKKQPDPPK